MRSGRRPALAAAALLGLSLMIGAEPRGGIRLALTRDATARSAFEVIGLEPAEIAEFERGGAERSSAVFAVYVARGSAGERPAMIGDYSVRDGRLRFEPRYPLEPGMRYRAVYRSAERPGVSIAREFAIPRRRPGPPPTVTAVYPSAPSVPENLLRVYLHFSVPMRRGEAYRRIRLLEHSGRPIELPFLEIAEELWDRDGRRLTLLFDPGRIKRGLRPREEVGPVLQEGKRYRLVVDPGWPDAEGNRMARPYARLLVAGPPDDVQPSPASWTVTAPAGGGRGPLRIVFPEPLDRAMLERVLEVVDEAGGAVAGRPAVAAGERGWGFTPDAIWHPGAYRVLVDTALEDLAGNNIASRFEVDAFEAVTRRVQSGKVAIPFVVR